MKMGRTWILGLVAIGLSMGCKPKKSATVIQGQVIEAEKSEFGSAEAQLKKFDQAQNPTEAAANAVNEAGESEWGKQVKGLARELTATLVNCNEKYFKALKPDQLLVGKPALLTPNGVVTVLAKECDGILDQLDTGLMLLDGKHPVADSLLGDWTLLADMYKRVSRSAINIGAKSKRRKLNHAEMVAVLPVMTQKLIPNITHQLGVLMTLADNAKPTEAAAAFKTLSKAEALRATHAQIAKTEADLLALAPVWKTECHDLVKGDLYARRRHLKWVGEHWRRRLRLETKQFSRLKSGDAAFDAALKKTTAAFYTAVDTYLAASWAVGMAAIEDPTMIDEPKLKLGVEGFKKGGKALQKTVKKLKFPKA